MVHGPKPIPAEEAVGFWLKSVEDGVPLNRMNRTPRIAAHVTWPERSISAVNSEM